MTVNIRLTDTQKLSDPISTINDLPFGQAEKIRLFSLKNPQRRLESIGALVCLWELTKDKKAPLLITRPPDGKPHFQDPLAPHFSLSHSNGFSAAAVADMPVGLDIEVIEPRERLSDVAVRFFTDDERREFLTKGESTEAFFSIWTRKEAIAKLHGKGLLGNTDHNRPFVIQRIIHVNNKTLYLSLCAEKPIIIIRLITDGDEKVI